MNANRTPRAVAAHAPSDLTTTLRQLLSFGIFGLATNAVLFVGYMFLVDRGLSPQAAMSMTFAVGTSAGFALNRRWTFFSTGAVRTEWLSYIVVQGAGYVLNLIVLTLCVDGLGWPHAWVQGAMVFVVAGFTFALNKAWVFRVRSR